MPEEGDPDLQLRSRAGFGGARSRVAQPDQSAESGVVDNLADQQSAREEEVGSNFIDRDKFVLVGLAYILFNVLWFLGGWLLANILFGVAIIRFLNFKRLAGVTFLSGEKLELIDKISFQF